MTFPKIDAIALRALGELPEESAVEIEAEEVPEETSDTEETATFP